MWPDVSALNERQRPGYYFSALQKIGRSDEVMASWAHAAATPGAPDTGPIDNNAVILSYAHLRNSTAAHYALGPGGHGVTWDCKDRGGPSTANPAPGIGLIGNGTGCFTGTSPQAFSLGMTYDF
jgi:hypothetical protein